MRSIWYEFKVLLPTIFIAYIPTVTLLCVVAMLSSQTGIHISDFTRDPATVVRAPVYIGVLSNIGILLWCSSAAICLFTFAILRKGNDKELPSFFLISGLITSILLLDDFFLLHDEIYPVYLYIPEKVVMTGYGIMTLFYLIRFRMRILKTEFLLLFFALAFFGSSMLIDNLPLVVIVVYEFLLGDGFNLYSLLEDGFKLLGIVSWSAYFVRVSLKQVCNAIWASKCE